MLLGKNSFDVIRSKYALTHLYVARGRRFMLGSLKLGCFLFLIVVKKWENFSVKLFISSTELPDTISQSIFI